MSGAAMGEAKFDGLAAQILPPLLRYMTRLAGATDAEDICAETMTTLWKKGLAGELPAGDLDRVVEQTRPLAFRIAQGHLLNHRRAAHRWRAMIRAAGREEATRRPSIADAAAEVIASDALVSIAAGLRPQDRLVIALVVDDFSRAEIAAILDISEDALKMRLSRIRRQLRETRDAAEEWS